MDLTASANVNYGKEEKKVVVDLKTFNKDQIKVEEIGHFYSKNKIAISSDGDGKIKIKSLKSPKEKLKELKNMYDEYLISDDEYKSKKKEILDEM